MSFIITFQKAFDIIEEVERNGLPRTCILEKLKEIKNDVIIDKKLSNFVARVRNHHSRNKDMTMNAEIVPSSPKSEIGPFCSAVGLTRENILGGNNFFNIPDKELTQGLVFELEQFRRDNEIEFGDAIDWLKRIWGERVPFDQMHTNSIRMSFSRIFQKTRELRRKGGVSHKKALDECHQKQFIFPQKAPSIEEKLAMKLSKTIAPLASSMSAESLLSFAQKQGKEIGQFTKAMTETAVTLHRKATDALQEVDQKDAELIKKDKESQETKRTLVSVEHKLATSKQQLLQAETRLKEIEKKFRPRNVVRREANKANKIQKLKQKQKEEIKHLKKDNKETVAQLKQQLQDKEKEIQHLNTVVEAEQGKNKELKQAKVNSQKRASKYKIKLQQDIQTKTNQELLDRVHFLENENAEMKEAVEEFMKTEDVIVWKDGRYSDEVRSIYMELLSNGVSTTKCNQIVQSVLQNLGGKSVARLPKHTMATQLKAEAAALAKIQCGVTMLDCENNTIHIDGTKKKFREFNTVNITTGKGQSLSLGFDEMSGGSASDYLCSTLGIMQEIAELLLPQDASQFQKDEKLAELLSTVRNTMTDRHIVNKCFNDSLQDVRENYMSLIKDNMETLSDEQLKQLVHMNNLFCSVHVVGNCGAVAKTSLKDFEEICDLPNDANAKGTSQTYNFLYALSKATTFGHDYQKAGVANYWAVFMEELCIQSQIMSLKGERINVLFLLGGAAFYHRNHLVAFLEERVPHNNLLLTALQAIKNPVIQAGCRALGILGQLVTDPLFRIISDAHSVLDLDEVWDDVLKDMQQYADNPHKLMEGKGPDCLLDSVKTTSPKHQCLFEKHGENIDSLTSMCLRMLCISIAILLKRQLKDQLPGGKFHRVSPEVMAETANCPATNLITERDFAHLDRQLKEKPNISTIAVTGTVMFLNNKTAQWLNTLDSSTKAEYMEKARKNAPQLIKEYKKKKATVRKNLAEKMKSKQDLKEKQAKKKECNTEMLIRKVAKVGGLFKDSTQMEEVLAPLDEQSQYEVVCDQIKLRKSINTDKGDHKKFYITEKGNKLDLSKLKRNLREIMHLNSEKTPEQSTSSINTEEVCEKVTERVQVKRKELDSLEVESRHKKAKTEPSLVGKNIHHKWKLQDGSYKWYEGTVLKSLDDEKSTQCRYEVKYAGDEVIYEVPLQEDLAEHNLVIQQ